MRQGVKNLYEVARKLSGVFEWDKEHCRKNKRTCGVSGGGWLFLSRDKSLSGSTLHALPG
jgi:hypothetical protein